MAVDAGQYSIVTVLIHARIMRHFFSPCLKTWSSLLLSNLQSIKLFINSNTLFPFLIF